MANDPANQIDPDGRVAKGAILAGTSSTRDQMSGGDMSGAWTWDFGLMPGSTCRSAWYADNGWDMNAGGGGGGGSSSSDEPSQGDGDATDVYTKTGDYAGRVKDNLPNQVHFVDGNLADIQGLISYLNGLSDADRNAIVGMLRGLSIAFIGKEGVSQLYSLAMTAAGIGDFGQETPFYATISATRELTFKNFPGNNNGSALQTELGTAVRNLTAAGGNINNTFGTGHPHVANWYNGFLYASGEKTRSPAENMANYSRITAPRYDPDTKRLQLYNYNNVYNRQVPLFINSPVGITIYNTNFELKVQHNYYYNWFK